MAYSTSADQTQATSTTRADAGARTAYGILHWAFAVLPIVAGIDKFLDWLTDWDKYLAPWISSTLNVDPHGFMMFVGVVEIIAGLLVIFWPRVGAYVVAVWLAGIIINLCISPFHYWDVAVRDFFLLLSALALGSLSASAAVRD